MPPRRSEALAPLLTLASLLALDACSTDGQAGLGAAGSSSAQFPGGHHLVPNAAGRPRWVDGCEEMRFGDHTVSIQQMNARTGGPRSHRPWWLDEEAGRGAVDGTGGVVWGSARVLCEHLDAHPQVVRGKSVFELGSGTGVAALLCCSMGAKVVTATDVPEQLALIEHNARLNPSLRLKVAPLKWGSATDLAAVVTPGTSPDVLIGTDLVYAGADVDALVSTLHALLGPTTQALVVLRTGRQLAAPEVNRFLAECSQRFAVETKDTTSPEGVTFVLSTLTRKS